MYARFSRSGICSTFVLDVYVSILYVARCCACRSLEESENRHRTASEYSLTSPDYPARFRLQTYPGLAPCRQRSFPRQSGFSSPRMPRGAVWTARADWPGHVVLVPHGVSNVGNYPKGLFQTFTFPEPSRFRIILRPSSAHQEPCGPRSECAEKDRLLSSYIRAP